MIIVGKTDCKVKQLGTALSGCLVIMGQLIKFILVERGEKLNIQSDTLDMDKVKELIQSGKMIVLPNHLSIEDNSEETVYTTLGSGVNLFVRDGLLQLLVQYSASICLGRALAQLSSRKWDILLIDESNKVFFEHTADEFLKGFETSLVQAEKMTLNDGANPAMKPLRVQLSPSGNHAFNYTMDYFESKSIDWVNLEGVQDVVLEVVSSTTTNLVIKVVNGCDKSTVIEGLADPYLWRIVDANSGLESGPARVTFEDGAYTISPYSAGDYLVGLYDKINNHDIISVGTNFIKTTEKLSLTIS